MINLIKHCKLNELFKILIGISVRVKRSLVTIDPKDFVVDHPFVFYILSKNASVVFVGRMTDIDSLAQNIIKEEL